jgi:hypothetical protein
MLLYQISLGENAGAGAAIPILSQLQFHSFYFAPWLRTLWSGVLLVIRSSFVNSNFISISAGNGATTLLVTQISFGGAGCNAQFF